MRKENYSYLRDRLLNTKKSVLDLNKNDKVLIIHHWDCDGLCSAALIIRYLHEINKDIRVFTETGEIGKYYLTPEKIDSFKSIRPHHIVLCDYALPTGDILKLKDISRDLAIFDHHKQKKIKGALHINPIMDKDIDGLSFPSTGWVINDYFGKKQEILAVLGAVGDQEELIRQDNTVKRVLAENGLNLGRAIKIVENLDSCYIAGDEVQIRQLVELLCRERSDIKRLLKNKSLLNNKKKIGDAIKSIVDEEKKIDDGRDIVFVKYKSDFHIISNVTRGLSRRFPDYLIVVVSDPGNGEANIYFRTRRDVDLRPIIGLAHSKGYNAGGKKEVAGIILPREDISGFIDRALEVLNL